mgnify:CR=1 FL=1
MLVELGIIGKDGTGRGQHGPLPVALGQSGRRRTLADLERTKTMRAGKVLEAVGPHFIKSTSSSSTASGTSIGSQARCVRASKNSCLSALSSNRCAIVASRKGSIDNENPARGRAGSKI